MFHRLRFYNTTKIQVLQTFVTIKIIHQNSVRLLKHSTFFFQDFITFFIKRIIKREKITVLKATYLSLSIGHASMKEQFFI